MHRILQPFIDALIEGSDEQALRRAMETAASSIDLSFFAYLMLPSGPCQSARLISNYPAQWTSHYLQQHHERLDPVIRRVQYGTEPFEWGPDLNFSVLSPQQLELLADAAAFGIRYGYTVPIHDRHGRLAAVTFASPERGPVFRHCIEHNGPLLQLMAHCFHAHARRKRTDRAIDGVTLSPREIACLEWAAQGKTAWEIGRILGIERRTAAFHLDNAKSKLGVHSVCQAVARLIASRSKTGSFG
jgi:LuxR family transcriptional regulator, activator of conjugal transfer of Ti plasmids